MGLCLAVLSSYVVHVTGMLNTLVPAEFVAPLVPPCLPFVAEQLRHAQGEVLIMSMETIIAILEVRSVIIAQRFRRHLISCSARLQAHAAVVPKVEAALSQITLDVWAAHGNDGHEVLEAVKVCALSRRYRATPSSVNSCGCVRK